MERARGLTGVLRERQRSLAQALDAAADADVVSTLEAEGARLAEELAADRGRGRRPGARAGGGGGGRGRGRRRAGGPSGGPGRRSRAAPGRRGRHRGPGPAGLARARPGAGPALAGPAHPPAWRATERRVAVLEGEDHELGERLAETEQARHRLQAAGGRDRGGPRAGHPPAGGGRGGAAPGRAGARTVRWPGPTPWSGPSTRPGVRPAPSCWPGSTAWSAPCSTWSRWTQGGRTPSRPPPGPRWPPWWSRAASRPGRPWPACARAGPPVRCWPSPSPVAPGPGRPQPASSGAAGDRVHPRPRAAPLGGPGTSPASTRVLDTLLAGAVLRPWAAGPRPSTWPWPAPTWWW